MKKKQTSLHSHYQKSVATKKAISKLAEKIKEMSEGPSAYNWELCHLRKFKIKLSEVDYKYDTTQFWCGEDEDFKLSSRAQKFIKDCESINVAVDLPLPDASCESNELTVTKHLRLVLGSFPHDKSKSESCVESFVD